MCERGSGGVFVSNAVQSILQESVHAWIDRSERSLSTSAGRIILAHLSVVYLPKYGEFI